MKNHPRAAAPDSIADLADRLETLIPGVSFAVDPPRDADGEWWLDIARGNFRTAVAWRRQQGFGLFTGPAKFSDRPDEIEPSAARAAQRITQLLESPDLF